jgi:hypothetical protein
MAWPVARTSIVAFLALVSVHPNIPRWLISSANKPRPVSTQTVNLLIGADSNRSLADLYGPILSGL